MVKSPAMTWTVVFGLACVICTAVAAYGRMVGGRTEIENVETNEEVQKLGRFSVEEYNRLWRKEKEELDFVEVVEAEEQVVAGIKYYLKILTRQSGGASRMFESVVVVKPWLHSKQLLNFAPSNSFPGRYHLS